MANDGRRRHRPPGNQLCGSDEITERGFIPVMVDPTCSLLDE